MNVGEASGAYVDAAVEDASLRSSCVCVAVEIGLFASVVLSTFPRPTCAFVTPETVPVNVGEESGAYVVLAVTAPSFEASCV